MPPRAKKKELTPQQKVAIARRRSYYLESKKVELTPRQTLEQLAEVFDAFNTLEKVAENAGVKAPFDFKNGDRSVWPAAFCGYLIRACALKDPEGVVDESFKCYASESSTERTIGFSWNAPNNPTRREKASISIRYSHQTIKQN